MTPLEAERWTGVPSTSCGNDRPASLFPVDDSEQARRDMAQAEGIEAKIAERRGLSIGAVRAIQEALQRGRGSAQWNHPDLGGMGQWLGGGMLQIGDMFNHDLKARVAAAVNDLVEAGAVRPPDIARDGVSHSTSSEAWWPADLGAPASTGAQNAMRYACFPDKRRLAIERDGRTIVYDTGRYRLTGFAQAQGADQTLTFSGPDGSATVDDLSPVD